MDEHRHPDVSGAEIDRRQQRTQRGRKDALHQNAQRRTAGEVGQVGRTEVKTRQQAGFPDAGPAGAEVFQKRLGDDAPEQKLFCHTDAGHADKEPHDVPCRQHIALRPAKQQGVVGVVADERDGVQAHQQTVEKAAAPAAEQAALPGARQKEPRHQHACCLLHEGQHIIIDGINIPHDEQDEQKRQQRCHEQHPQKQHLSHKAVEHRVGAAQTFEHRKTSCVVVVLF